jgi:hypothetical protein
MVAKKGKKSTRGMKDLPAKKLNAMQAKDVKGGSGSTGGDDEPTRKIAKHKPI